MWGKEGFGCRVSGLGQEPLSYRLPRIDVFEAEAETETDADNEMKAPPTPDT